MFGSPIAFTHLDVHLDALRMCILVHFNIIKSSYAFLMHLANTLKMHFLTLDKIFRCNTNTVQL